MESLFTNVRWLLHAPCLLQKWRVLSILSIFDWAPEPAATSSGDELARWRWDHMLPIELQRVPSVLEKQ
jgi:hypothetical protein